MSMTCTTSKPYSAFDIVRPMEVQGGKAAPWFGETGKGVQYELPMSVEKALAEGYLRRLQAMDRSTFLKQAENRGIRPDAYSLGRRVDEAYVMEKSLLGWSTFYFERGLKTDSRRFLHQSDALSDLMERLERDGSTRR
ncbi:TNT domain-containing protein [Sphingomonas sp. CFBP 8760]|uniref:TNT domain-containing protein n=1 Tax=Sphingomonas sp. CFBP 8760 TaxID=2775282 RepID=UPI003145676E